MFSTYESRKEEYRQKCEEEEEERLYDLMRQGEIEEEEYDVWLRDTKLCAGNFVMSHSESGIEVFEYSTEPLFTLHVNNCGECPQIRVESSVETTDNEKEGVILAYLMTIGESTYTQILHT